MNPIIVIESSPVSISGTSYVYSGSTVTLTIVSGVSNGLAVSFEWFVNDELVNIGQSYTYTPSMNDEIYVSVINCASSLEREYSWVVKNPTTGTILGPRVNTAGTLLPRVDAYVNTATDAVFNIGYGPANGTSSNILAADGTAGTVGVSFTSGLNTPSNGDWLTLIISAVNGTPDQLVVTYVY